MALRNIVAQGDIMLRRKAREVEHFDDRLWTLLDDMCETLRAQGGVGIAAPQVGIMKRIAIIDTDDGLIELVNPVIFAKKGSQYQLEGCLSLPGMWGYVERPFKVKIRARNRYGKPINIEGDDMLAVALCHEVDHLDGVLFTDIAAEMVDPDQVEEHKENRKISRRKSG
ncbi:MAG: peptide deformylase [Oscillospiraceae bacterium]|nr:peptide deformylase [Oscillospiraceae bacterium]